MINKKDFIELDFTAIIAGSNEVFDTTIPEDAKKTGLAQNRNPEEFKPLRICVGEGMVLKNLDNAFVGKEIGKEYGISLQPKDAFGLREPSMIKTMSLNQFRQRGIEPAPGMTLALDNLLVRISAVSSGRVIVDFNNPLSGKEVIYKFIIKKKIDENKDKLRILADFFLGVAENAGIENDKGIVKVAFLPDNGTIEEFKKKVRDVIGIEVELAKSENKDKNENIEKGLESEKRKDGKDDKNKETGPEIENHEHGGPGGHEHHSHKSHEDKD